MLTVRALFALAAASCALGCGANTPETTLPDLDTTPESEVIVERSTLLLADGSEMVPIAIRFPVDSAELDEKDKRVLDLLAPSAAA